MISSRPRLASVLTLALVASSSLAGCAYKSSYRQTNFDVTTQPVPQDKVKVVKSKDDLTSAWTEIGLYRGRAPSVKEAMDVAKNLGSSPIHIHIAAAMI